MNYNTSSGLSAQDKAECARITDYLATAADGQVKQASAAGSETIRLRLREDCFSPNILPYTKVSDSDFAYTDETEEPFIYGEIETDIEGPKTMAFNDTGDVAMYYGQKFRLTFHKNETPTFTKNVDWLRTYRGDVRAMVTDNCLRDLSRLKDVGFMALVDGIVGVTPGVASDRTSLVQYINMEGRLTRDNWVDTQQYLSDRMLPDGIYLTNKRTFAEFQRWDFIEMGGEKSQDLILNGTGALQNSTFGGKKFLVTLKSDLVPVGAVYQFSTPNYLGKAAVLQEPTMYVEKKKDILSFSCSEKLGVVIANAAAVQKVTYSDVTVPVSYTASEADAS